MTDFTDVWYQSQDGLKLYARDYNQACPTGSPVILCMHGLTRNSADFEEIANMLKSQYRLVVVDQRGRGRSAYDPDSSRYTPATYVKDMFTLIDFLELNDIVLMGTSMGGLMSMIMHASDASKLKATIINDIGPDLSPAGIERIKGYLGQSEPLDNWFAAAEQTKRINQVAFPNEADDFWLRFAKRIYIERDDGTIQLAYDPRIAEPFNQGDGAAEVDLWPMFNVMAQKPTLVVRGELSDLLSRDCVNKMMNISKNVSAVEVKGVGHAPFLNEADGLRSIQRFLAQL